MGRDVPALKVVSGCGRVDHDEAVLVGERIVVGLAGIDRTGTITVVCGTLLIAC